MLKANDNIQYIRNILGREEIRQFDILCAQVGSTTIVHLNLVIFRLGTCLSKSARCAGE